MTKSTLLRDQIIDLRKLAKVVVKLEGDVRYEINELAHKDMINFDNCQNIFKSIDELKEMISIMQKRDKWLKEK